VTLRRPGPYLTLALVCLPIFIGALDLTVVSAVLPHVVFDLEIPLQTGLDDAAWVVSGYLLAYTVAMAFMGRLSDLAGRRAVYLAALLIFTLGSLWVAVADDLPARWLTAAYRALVGVRPDPARMDLWALIAGRAVQAFGGGAMVPVSMALVGDLFPPERRAGPLGFIGAVDTAGWVVGHLYGGVLVRFFDWRVIFWLNLPVCLLAFALIAWRLRGLPQPRAAGRFDWPGALSISAALVALSLGLGGGGELSARGSFGSQAPPQVSLPWLTAAAVFFLVFLLLEWRGRHPLLPLGLFRDRNFALAGLTNLLVGFSLVIAIANVPLFINTLVAADLQQGAWDSGWMLSGLTVPMAFAALAGGALTGRLGYRWPAAVGLLAAVSGFGLMSAWAATTPYSVMLPHLVLAGLGFGLVIAPIAAAVVNAAGEAQRGVASALVILLRLCGMTLGLSAMTTYGLQRADHLLQARAAGLTNLAQSAAAGMQIANQVIAETFLIAAVMALTALPPALGLRPPRARPAISSVEVRSSERSP